MNNNNSNNTLVRAWKDEDVRENLGIESPVGAIELNDAELDAVQGGYCQVASIIIVICKEFSIVCAFTIAIANG
jgi:mersacidin/lichenicidin family type 2 lantibiotic